MTGSRWQVSVALAVLLFLVGYGLCRAESLWDTARRNSDVLKIATLFTAQNVRDHLSTDEGVARAVNWCKQTGVTHVFIESYRDGYTAERNLLMRTRKRFFEAGFEVSGCVTTTGVGKTSTGWRAVSCYTDEATQQRLQEIFEYTASIFDEIMIDDFLFTDCTCEQCTKARGGKSWAEYRSDLMLKVSRERILEPAKKVNPDAHIIIKYPQWYDNFHNRGYDIVRQTEDFDEIWVGTETRDYDNSRWGGKVQYEAYYIMRWLGETGGKKTGGGWFDPYGTTEDTYVEQARQTVLADAKEMLLFCYGSLLDNTGPANVVKLRAEIPGLFELAKMVRGKPIKGIAAPKLPDSDAKGEEYVYDFVGMLGLPLVPVTEIDPAAEAIFLPIHSLKDPYLTQKVRKMLDEKKAVLVTDGLAEELSSRGIRDENITVLKLAGQPRNLLELSRQDLRPIRDKMLAPLKIKFDAPNKVALYLIGDDCVVIENFNDEPIDAELTFADTVDADVALVLPGEGKVDFLNMGARLLLRKVTPRTLVAVRY